MASGKFKKRCLKDLSTEERTSIIHAHMIEFLSQEDVSKQFRVSPNLVSSLCTRIKKCPDMLAEHRKRFEEKEKINSSVLNAATELLS